MGQGLDTQLVRVSKVSTEVIEQRDQVHKYKSRVLGCYWLGYMAILFLKEYTQNCKRIEKDLNGSQVVNTDLQCQSPFIRLGKREGIEMQSQTSVL